MNAELFYELVRALPDAKERRRYALLQAAATMQAGFCSRLDVGLNNSRAVLNEAEFLLAEIEKGQKAETDRAR